MDAFSFQFHVMTPGNLMPLSWSSRIWYQSKWHSVADLITCHRMWLIRAVACL